MNASTDTMTRAPAANPPAAPHATHRYRMLLRREYWEHKGGFLWAPLVAGAISLGLTLLFAIIALVAAHRAAAGGELEIDGEMMVNGLDLGLITSRLGPEEMRQLGAGLDVSLLMASSWPFIVLAFVVFFYCLGALYDERKDRSVLFWKSLPLSDRDTVLSKTISAAVVAPALATVAAIATMYGFMLLVSAIVLAHGGNPVTLLWGPASPLYLAAHFIAAIPVYAVWALPTIGWLLLCSAWARSKPFLWAVMIPVFAGVIVSWFDLMEFFDLETLWFWKNVVGRSLLSVVPIGWLDALDLQGMAAMGRFKFESAADIRGVLNLKVVYSAFASPKMWIGAAAGVAMILAAIRLRRWRDEG
ncbi:hypothetical protein [Luteimonas suaedae]|uniref:hypothetical protein n=1 Tax=Luteimonas suaedae TaxID=2605430 RepID=UPI002105BF57|nr:hypothetical protein [Luteimonas suaedae]